MSRIKKIIKRMLIGIVVVLGIITLGTVIFVNTSPQFGGSPSNETKALMVNSPNYKEGTFQNLIPTAASTGFEWSSIPKFFTNGDNKVPSKELPQAHIAKKVFNDSLSQPRITWFGHSAVFVEMEGLNIFIDPMLGEVPAPHPMLGNSRFNKELPMQIDSLPPIDVVLISHDHYDHLDYESITKLHEKVEKFYVPLGVKAHLVKWGVSREKITEFDWWNEQTFKEVKFVSTPARHFSGRGFSRNNTLWSSWVIKSGNHSIYFSGDSGYGPHFKEIGKKFGPFDFAMMECGQYNKQWAHIHMTPEETILASKDVQSKLVLPIHWGAFKLALHSWDDPIVRATSKAQELGINVTTPIIGESILIGNNNYPKSYWWKNISKSK